MLTEVTRHLVRTGRIWPKSAKFVRNQRRRGRSLPKLVAAQSWPNPSKLAEYGKSLAEFGANWATSAEDGRNRPKVGGSRANLTERDPALPEVGRLRTTSGRLGPSGVQMRSNSAVTCRKRSKHRRVRPKLAITAPRLTPHPSRRHCETMPTPTQNRTVALTARSQGRFASRGTWR